jgi:hypothetical protein
MNRKRGAAQLLVKQRFCHVESSGGAAQAHGIFRVRDFVGAWNQISKDGADDEIDQVLAVRQVTKTHRTIRKSSRRRVN